MADKNDPVTKRVLIIDDDRNMGSELAETFEDFNQDDFETRLGMGILADYRFVTDIVESVKDIGSKLKGNPSYDVLVIDRKFQQERDVFDTQYLAQFVLQSLRDLQLDCLMIVWTAYPVADVQDQEYREPENKEAIRCMRLGAWDYLDKGNPQYGDTFTDVIVSTIEGLQQKHELLLKERLDREGHEFVVKHYGELYAKYKGNFLAFEKDNENWKIEPVASDESLYGLYAKLDKAGRKRTQVHITMIQE